MNIVCIVVLGSIGIYIKVCVHFCIDFIFDSHVCIIVDIYISICIDILIGIDIIFSVSIGIFITVGVCVGNSIPIGDNNTNYIDASNAASICIGNGK